MRTKDEKKLFAVIRASFGQRRKTLANALTNGFCYEAESGKTQRVTRQQVYDVLEQMELSQTIRGEALTLEQFAELSDLL